MYNFNKNSIFTRFFSWIWNVNPSTKYKTMCPYFWSYILTMLFIVVILPIRVLIWLVFQPIYKVLDKQLDKAVDKRIKNLLINYEKCISLKDFFDLYNSRCFRNNKYQIDYYDRKILYNKVEEYQHILKAEKQAKGSFTDNIIYSKFSKYLSYFLSGVILYYIGKFIYWVLHLITMTTFLFTLKKVGLFLLIITMGIGICYLISKFIIYLQTKISCNNWLSKVVFWKPIGNFLFNIGLFIADIFLSIWTFFGMLIDMIKSFYNKSCPIIHWED